MAVLRMLGFEASSASEVRALNAGQSIVNTPLPTNGGGYVFKNDGTASLNCDWFNTLDVAPAITTTAGFWATFRFRVDSATAPAAWSYWRAAVVFDDNNTSAVQQAFVVVGQAPTGHPSAGQFTVYYNNGVADVINTFAPQITSGNWVEFKVHFAPYNPKIWLNGVKYEAGDGIVGFNPSASTTVRYFTGGSSVTSDATRPTYHDDICLFDNDPAGVPFVIARGMAANGTTTAWTAVGGANKFTNVSEVPFSATNAISSATASQIQDFTPASFSATQAGRGTGVITSGTHTILGAKISFVAKTSATSASGNLLKTRWLNSSAALTTWSWTTLTTADTFFDLNLGVNGVNGAGIFVPSSVTDLNSSQFGVDHDAGTRTKTVEDIFVQVCYVKTPRASTVASAGSYAMTGQVAGVKKGLRVAALAGSYSIAGQIAGVKKGVSVLALAGSYAVTGQTARVAKNGTVIATSGTYTITGQLAGVKVGKRVGALAGSYAITGSIAGIVRGLKVPASVGSYSISGSVAGVVHGWKIAAAVSSYSIAGQIAGVKKGLVVTAAAGTYSMSGTAAGTLHGWKVPAAAGSYVMSGVDAAITKGAPKSILASPGTYSMSGQIALVRKAYTLTASAGSYAMAGQTAGVKVNRVVAASAGSYQLTGTSAGVRRALNVLAQAGTYQLTGQAAGILKARSIIGGTSSYTLTGQPALTIQSRKVAADPGGYLISGTDAALTKSSKGTSPFMVGSGGEMPAVHRQRDTRWDGIRAAREEARSLFDKVAATPVARRKEAAVRASEAVAKIAKSVGVMTPSKFTPLHPVTGELDYALGRLLDLQAYLQGLIDQQEAIKAAQAREAAQMWAMIERELAAEAAREEELMMAFSLLL